MLGFMYKLQGAKEFRLQENCSYTFLMAYEFPTLMVHDEKKKKKRTAQNNQRKML